MRTLIAIPIYNEERYVCRVIDRVLEHGHDVLVIDDGSTDRSPELLAAKPVRVIRHETNQGYGRSLRNAFDAAAAGGYDWVITMDCDEQHEPDAIPYFLDEAGEGEADIISGSRYLVELPEDDAPPRERRGSTPRSPPRSMNASAIGSSRSGEHCSPIRSVASRPTGSPRSGSST